MPVAMNAFFAANAITTKAHLDTCGRAALYEYVKAHAPTHWARIKSPEQYIQGYYQRALEGYKHYKAPREAAVAIAEPPSTVAEDDSFLAEMEALLSSPAIPAPVFTAARVDEKVSAKAAAAAAKAAEKAAAKAAKAAEKAAAKEAEKAAAKEAEKAAKAAAWAAKAVAKAEEKAAAKAAAKAEPVDITGELKLIEGTLYMVKNDNVYEYDELSEKAGDFVGRLTAEETIDTDEEEVSVTVAAMASSAVAAIAAEVDTPPGTVVATLAPPAAATAPVALAPVALAKATASDVKRAATKEAKAVILRAQIARLQDQLARRQSELAALSG